MFFSPTTTTTTLLALSIIIHNVLPTFGETSVVDVLSSSFEIDRDGFKYIPDMFYDTASGDRYSKGHHQSKKERLRMLLGGIDNTAVNAISGGFKKVFTIENDVTEIELEFLFAIDFSKEFDTGDNVDIICRIDNAEDFVYQYKGTNDETDHSYYKGNRRHVFKVGKRLAGNHVIRIGAYLSKKNNINEEVKIFFDEVEVRAKLAKQDYDDLSTSTWETISYTGKIKKRHEACFLMVGRKAYLIGGRGNNQVDIYDPTTQSWSIGNTKPDYQLHHMQCVSYKERYVYIVSAWNGAYPNEKNVDVVWVYDTIDDNWFTKTALPEHRRRGGGSAVLIPGTDEIYVTHGNRGGHGEHATSLGWTDKYNIEDDTWTTNLADAPNPRDHTGGAYMYDGRICVSGGRNGGSADFSNNVILPTDCYDPKTNTWTVQANIPQGRAGSAYGTTCDGRLIIAGGEGNGIAYDQVDVFDGKEWITIDNLDRARHGTGLAISCEEGNKQIHIASGSGAEGGKPELSLLENLYIG